MKILVIEDKLDNVKRAKEELKDHDVRIARSVGAAKKFFFANKPNWLPEVVLTDIWIPAHTATWPEDKEYDNAPEERVYDYTHDVELSRKGEPPLLHPAGVFFAWLAQSRGMRVCVVTDKNGHNDALAYLFEIAREQEIYGRSTGLPAVTREKNYAEALERAR